ncbi:MAG: hypothetical protein RL757_2599 [Bacteroidota bacterium]|jgi:phosphate transport system substrate-binding protein
MTLRNKILTVGTTLLLGIGLSNCWNKTPEKEVDTARSGTTNIGCDETLKPIVEVEAAIFQSLFPQTKINIIYSSESQAIYNLMKDSVDAIFVGRNLDTSEASYFKRQELSPQQNHICTDAIAFVVHPSNRDTNITYEKMMKILRGEITTWSQVGGGAAGNINIVFDQANSGTVATVLRKIGKNTLPATASGAKSNTEAIEYVAQNPNAIGIVGWSWLSDTDDHLTQDYFKKIKVVGLTRPVDSLGGKAAVFAKPFAENLAHRFYPFDRDVFVIVRERRMGLAAGFSNFVYSDNGQRVISKAGLLPANAPSREIQIKKVPPIRVTQ